MCDHKHGKVETITLPPSCARASLYTDNPKVPQGLKEQILLYLTAGSQASRWRALIAIAHYHRHVASRREEHRKVMPRELGCCFQCTIDQAFLQGGQ